jgi:transposase-like protein
MKTHDARFTPPHCPDPECPHHRDTTHWVWKRAGYFTRKAWPHRIRRFRCTWCGRYFSTQTFDTTYWLKRPDLQQEIWRRSVECVAHRQAGRGLGVVHTTVQRQTERLGRHALLFQASKTPEHLSEREFGLDGLRTFENSQFWPFDLNLVIGRYSHYMYGFTDAELRRSGRMTPAQKKRRQELEERYGRPDPKATEKEVEHLLRLVFGEDRVPPGTVAVLWSDDQRDYLRSIAKLGMDNLIHRTVSSREPRTPANPLFSVNVADMLIRHCSAAQKRETIAFAKRRQAAAERAAIWQVWRNFMKPASERKPKGPTPAMRAGVLDRRVSMDELFHRRLFPTLVELPPRVAAYYWREVPTRVLPNGRTHRLKYAF